ncbi:MAG TPA: lytic transglycosylase domain-containing protein [Pseudonocardiaceae bacterium]|nr:lytic transglycosylase domain-containing protein [Pseudonocardiaceae bacterium]
MASTLVTLPVALFGDVAAGWVNAADSTPLTGPDSNQVPTGTPGYLGATGANPHDSQLSTDVLHDSGDPAALAKGAGSAADLPSGPLGIPGIVLNAYLQAQQTMATEDPACHLPWWLLAGIGKVESSQAENGEVATDGTTLRPILGPELNGRNGTAAIPAILGGRWTGDPVWQRAVGPMQFLPSTWLEYGQGGDPNNVYDAALAAGRYLCKGGGDLSDPAQQAVAVFNYNHSDSYVQLVLVWADAYEAGVTPLPETSVPYGPVLADSQTGNTTGGLIPPVTTGGNPPPTGTGTPVTTTAPPTTTTAPPTTTTAPPTTTTAPPTTTTSPTCPSDPPTTTPPTSTTTTTPPPSTTTTAPPTDPSCPPPTTTTTPPTVTTTPDVTPTS